MNLIVHQVVQLQDVLVTHRNRIRERLTGAAVNQTSLTGAVDQTIAVAVRVRVVHEVEQLVLVGAIEHRGCQAGRAGFLREVRHVLEPLGLALNLPTLLSQPTGVDFQNLTNVHTTGHAQRVQDDVHGGTVFQEGHILDRQNLGNNTLVTVAACELVAVGNLTLLSHVHADQLVHARGQIVLVIVLAVEDADTDDGTGLAVRNLQGGVANLAGLLTEDGAQQALLGGQLGLTLGGDLTDEDVASLNLSTDVDDAALVQSRENILGHVRDVAGNLLGAQLGVAGVNLVLLDVNRGQHVLRHHALGEDDRILVVQAFPRHVGHEQVLTQCQLATIGGGAVSNNVAVFDALAFLHHNALVVAVTRVRAGELHDRVGGDRAVVVTDDNGLSVHGRNHTGLLREHGVTGVECGVFLHTGTHHRSLRLQQGHSLTLHVSTHQCSVSVVVLQVRNQGGSDRHHLTRGDVHELNGTGSNQNSLARTIACTAENLVLSEGAVRVQRCVCLRDNNGLLVVRGQVADLIGHATIGHHAVGGLNETEGVDATVGCQRTNQTNVRAFRGFNGAHTTVVRGVHVSHFHTCTVTRQTARAQCGQTTLVGQTRQRVVLVHELGQLRSTEELLDSCHDGANVHQRLGGDSLNVLSGHALANHTLHTGQTGTNLVLNQLTHGADTTVAEVVDIVDVDLQGDFLAIAHARDAGLTSMQSAKVTNHLSDVVLAKHRSLGGIQGNVHAQLTVQLVTANLRQVVTARGEVHVVQQSLGSFNRRGLTRAQLAVNVQQSLIAVPNGVLLEGCADGVVLTELSQNLGLGPTQSLEQNGHRLLTLAVQTHAHLVALINLKLEPSTAGGNHAGRVNVLIGSTVRSLLEVGTGGTHQLGDDHTLSTVNHEGTGLGHQGEVAHEQGLLLDLTGGEVHKFSLDIQRCRVGCIAILALLNGVLGVGELGLGEGELHGLLEVANRGNLFKDLSQTGLCGNRGVTSSLRSFQTLRPALVTHEAVEAIGLDSKQVGNLQRFINLRE